MTRSQRIFYCLLLHDYVTFLTANVHPGEKALYGSSDSGIQLDLSVRETQKKSACPQHASVNSCAFYKENDKGIPVKVNTDLKEFDCGLFVQVSMYLFANDAVA